VLEDGFKLQRGTAEVTRGLANDFVSLGTENCGFPLEILELPSSDSWGILETLEIRV